MWAKTNDPEHLAAAAEGISASSKVGTFAVHEIHGVEGFRDNAEAIDSLAAEFCPAMMRRAPLGDYDGSYKAFRRLGAMLGVSARKRNARRRRGFE